MNAKLTEASAGGVGVGEEVGVGDEDGVSEGDGDGEGDIGGDTVSVANTGSDGVCVIRADGVSGALVLTENIEQAGQAGAKASSRHIAAHRLIF